MIGLKSLFVALISMLSLVISSLAHAEEHTTHKADLYLEYSGSVLVFQIAKLVLNARITDHDYTAAVSFNSAGLLSWVDDTDIRANVTGYINETGMQPYRYEHTNLASSKGRVVGIDFPNGIATPNITPAFSSMGEPPATKEELTGANDPVSVLLSLTIEAMLGETACSGTREVFDGKARYNLRLESSGQDQVRTLAYKGKAEHCRAYMEPISGYDLDDRPNDEEIAEPINIWLAKINGQIIPVRFRANTKLGNINVTASRITVSSLTQSQ